MWATTTYLFQPWWGFCPAPSDDPDVRSFDGSFRFLAWWWVAATVGALTAGLDVYRRRSKARSAPPGELRP